MRRELSHAELRELLGAYALDAVDDDERQAVERHLETCPSCRTEVGEHREVAALLAAGWVPAPEGVWDRIAGALDEAPPPMRVPPVVPLDGERSRRRVGGMGRAGRAAVALGVAASVALVGLLGVKVLDTSERVDQVATALQGENVEQAANAAAASPDARRVALRSGDGHLWADAVVLPDGTGYVLRTNLPRLPANRTYQLWGVAGTNKISVGVLGPAPGPVAFRAAGPYSALAITEEVAGGVVATQQAPRVVGQLA